MTAPEKKPAALVIAVGNPLRCDDGAGPAVAHWLIQWVPDSIAVVRYNGDGTGLMNLWQGVDWVILVDAVCSGQIPGTVHRYNATQTELPGGTFADSSHLFGLSEAVELARSLGRLPGELIVYGIEGAVFSYGEELTPLVTEAVKEVGHRILIELTDRFD